MSSNTAIVLFIVLFVFVAGKKYYDNKTNEDKAKIRLELINKYNQLNKQFFYYAEEWRKFGFNDSCLKQRRVLTQKQQAITKEMQKITQDIRQQTQE